MTSKSLMNSLSEQEWTLLAETEAAALAGLDEDELVELHGRVRRARTKYQKQYRRTAAARVAQAGARGAARPANRRAADKAEMFEEGLARVSSALARAARASAAQLRAERLAAARADRRPPTAAASRPRSAARASADQASTRAKGRAASTRTPIAAKNVASAHAAGARRQARRDSSAGT